MTVEAQAATGPKIDPGWWERYGADWPEWAKGAGNRVQAWVYEQMSAITQADSAYAAFTRLHVYRESLETTLELLPSIPRGSVLDLGCGKGTAFPPILAATQADYLLGLDLSETMLADAQSLAKELGRANPVQKIDLRQVDIAKPWQEQGVEGQFDAIFSHLVICWLTPDQREQVMTQIAKHLTPNGQAVIGFRNKRWNQARVKRHIRDEIRHSWRATAGALFSRTHTDAMERQITSGLVGATRPTLEEMTNLISRNGLRVTQVENTFWPEDPEGPAGHALRAVKA
ncbi:MAG TPA: class I SAM-dependent methyltransferase [Candidatus Bathyarchaeia archaeon]|nr:class I SAM-dependent methyltransferase [Candidatus Bathyarchaeia archaeon]